MFLAAVCSDISNEVKCGTSVTYLSMGTATQLRTPVIFKKRHLKIMLNTSQHLYIHWHNPNFEALPIAELCGSGRHDLPCHKTISFFAHVGLAPDVAGNLQAGLAWTLCDKSGAPDNKGRKYSQLWPQKSVITGYNWLWHVISMG